MTKAIVTVNNIDEGDNGEYDGNVIGKHRDTLEDYSKETVVKYVLGIDEELEESDLEFVTPHPHDSNYDSMVTVCDCEFYHFKII